MSPEQARGKSVDKRTDIWAFGCALYEMITGRRAFDGETPSDAIAAILERQPDWTALPASIPASAARLLRRCLEKDLRLRQRDFGDVWMDLQAVHSEPSASPSSSSRTYAAAAGAVLVALGLAAAVTWNASRRVDARTELRR